MDKRETDEVTTVRATTPNNYNNLEHAQKHRTKMVPAIRGVQVLGIKRN